MSTYLSFWSYVQCCNDSLTLSGSFLSATGEVLYKMIRDNDFGYTVIEEDRVIICFAGSNSPLTLNGIKDWISNFNFLPLEENKTISDGFYDSWCRYKDQVSEIVNEYVDECKLNNKNINIVCLGHSRGAALALLCSRHISINLNYSCRFIGYGCPMVGNSTFANEFNKLSVEANRIRNGWDIVCFSPPEEFSFRHVGSEIVINQPIWHKWFPWLRISDHCNYKKALERANI
jgi:predicted lipase